MESLEEVVHLFVHVVYEEEKWAYHHLFTFQWKNSSISAGMRDVTSLAADLKELTVVEIKLCSDKWGGRVGQFQCEHCSDWRKSLIIGGGPLAISLFAPISYLGNVLWTHYLGSN